MSRGSSSPWPFLISLWKLPPGRLCPVPFLEQSTAHRPTPSLYRSCTCWPDTAERGTTTWLSELVRPMWILPPALIAKL